MKALHIFTPLWESVPLSKKLGASVLLKMEALQPVGSFKIRGIGRLCQMHKRAGVTRLVCSSGGNAGYAVAYAGRQLGLEVVVVVPRTTPEWMRQIIAAEDATVMEYGEAWDDAHMHAVKMTDGDARAAYVHPFDHPEIWKGHATLVKEIAEDGRKPGVMVLSVGGGGLLCGVVKGLHDVGWGDVPVMAVETEGAASLGRSVSSGHLITLEKIDSVATTLGARTVASEAFAWTKRHTITMWTVTDREAVDACLRFADDHRLLVEPACGASLSTVYHGAAPLVGMDPVVIVACGGAGVNLELLKVWDREV